MDQHTAPSGVKGSTSTAGYNNGAANAAAIGNHGAQTPSMHPPPPPPPAAGGRRGYLDPITGQVRAWYRENSWTKSRTKMDKKRKIQILISYLPDWIITILLALLLALINDVHGFRREFSLEDTSIQHTYAQVERVSTPMLVVYSFVIPVILIAAFSLLINRSAWDCHASLLGLVLTQALQITVVTIIKVCAGRPRPDLIDRCQPRAGSNNAPVYGLVTDAICTVDVSSHIITDGFRSFPSGHSSTAFAGLTYLSLYLAAKLHLFSSKKGIAASAWIVLAPMLGAALIAVSRTMDYRHHATDIIAGGIIGVLICMGTYFRYYPNLTNAQCHRPFAPRVPNLMLQHRHAADGAAERHEQEAHAYRSADHSGDFADEVERGEEEEEEENVQRRYQSGGRDQHDRALLRA